MPIDTQTPNSAGWWMKRLADQLSAERPRLVRLRAYFDGNPPLPYGDSNVQKAFTRAVYQSRTNFAAVICESPVERIRLRSVATKVASDLNGDPVAWQLVSANEFDSQLSQIALDSFLYGLGYAAVGAPDETGMAVITREDPLQVTMMFDPARPWRPLAMFKAFHDPANDLDVCILWLAGQKWVATRSQKTAVTPIPADGAPAALPTGVVFAASSFEWAPFSPNSQAVPNGYGIAADGYNGPYVSETYASRTIPGQAFPRRYGQTTGIFESHTDLLDRINHMILQRVVIATLQAFRQRAIELEEDLPERDEDGQLIDWDDLFSADPGALWKLPKGAKIWESGQVDLTGILSATKDDVLHLSAVTKTPMAMFTPDAATQTAEGASLQREGNAYSAESWELVAGRRGAQVIGTAFEFMDDQDRSDVSQISFDWGPVERYSLAEQGAAAAQSGDTLTWEQKQELIWQRTPQQIAVAKAQRMADAQFAMMMAAQGVQVQVGGTPHVTTAAPDAGS